MDVHLRRWIQRKGFGQYKQIDTPTFIYEELDPRFYDTISRFHRLSKWKIQKAPKGHRGRLPELKLREHNDYLTGTDKYSILQEICDLGQLGLVRVKAAGESIAQSAITDYSDVIPNLLVLTSIGDLAYRLMGLHEVPRIELEDVIRLLK